jgi:hypothetical protein
LTSLSGARREESFFAAFHSKIKRSAGARVHKWHSDAEQAESLHIRKQVCFSTLTTFAHNMCEFGMEPRIVIEFVEKIAGLNELEPEQLAMLQSMDVYAGARAADGRRHSDAQRYEDAVSANNRKSTATEVGDVDADAEADADADRDEDNDSRNEHSSEEFEQVDGSGQDSNLP